MAIREILLLGNPRLLEPSAPVLADELGEAAAIGRDLRDTLADFRARHGVGRAIAALQIGISKRIVFVEIDRPALLLNPELHEASDETMELWDDCLSFPELLVRVRRHRSCRIVYRDEQWRERSLFAEGDLSELLQHELDHLDGILATMRAVDGAAFSLRSQLSANW